MEKDHPEQLCQEGTQVFHPDLPGPGRSDKSIGEVKARIDRSHEDAHGGQCKQQHQYILPGKGPENQVENHEKEENPYGGVIIHTPLIFSAKYLAAASHNERLPESTPAVMKV